MEDDALIMRHEDGSKIASPEQMQAWMKQTMDWIGGISAQNKFVSGTGLPFQDAKVVSSNKVVTNGPFGDIKETIGGFITVRADSIDEAVEFAKGCPVLQGEGNTMEVRKTSNNESAFASSEGGFQSLIPDSRLLTPDYRLTTRLCNTK